MENSQYSRLAHFQKNPEAVSRFRMAISVLYQLNIDTLLLQIGLANIPEKQGDQLALHALSNAESVGFRKAIELLFSLADAQIPEDAKIDPDYGALERMLANGQITQEDYDKFYKDGEIADGN